MKLLRKSAVVVIAAALPAIVLAGVIIFFLTQSALKDTQTISQQEIARQTIDKIDRFLYERYLDIQSIANENVFAQYLETKTEGQDELNESVQERFSKLSFLSGPWDELALVDVSGKLIITAGGSHQSGDQFVAEDQAHEDVVTEALSGTATYSDFVINPSDGRPTMLFAAPVRSAKGSTVVGAVVAHISWPVITEILQEAHSIGELDLYAGDGRLIATSNPASKGFLYKKDADVSSLVEETRLRAQSLSVIREDEDDDFRSVLSTTAQSLGYLGFSGNGWVLMSEVPTEIAFAPATEIPTKTALLLVPIFLLGIGGIIYILNRYIVRPIVSLKNLTYEIASGHLDTKITLASNDEVGELASSFNSMSAELQKSYSILEEKVRERTASLREERDRSAAILTSMNEGLLVIRDDFTVQLANRTALSMLGINEEKIIGKDVRTVLQLMHGKVELPKEEWIITATLASKTPAVVRLEHNISMGCRPEIESSVLFPVTITSAPLPENGAVFLFRDITEEKRLDDAKSSFISIASHQLRTPLAAMNWITEMLLSGDLGPLTEKQKSFIQDLYSSNKKLIDMVTVLLASVRMETGRAEIMPVPTDLVATTNDVINVLHELISAKNIHIAVIADEQKIPKINLEPETFRQVILNLVSNAVNYTPAGGDITVTITTEANYALISVADTGIGVPKSEEPHIFEKFYRATNATTLIPDGNGLGLNFARSLVMTWSGKMWFKSEEGKGTTFYFTVPLAGAKAKKGDISLMA